MTEYEELKQLLMENDRAFNYCYQYFIDDVWDLRTKAHDSGSDEREVLSRYFASWIPWEPRADKLIARLRKLAGE